MPNLRGKTWTTSTPANVEDAQFWEDHLISNDDASKLENITGVPGGGSSGQVLTKTADGIGWRDPASSGHAIQNADGADMPYQGTLQFLGADVANDPENGKTVVDCHGQKGDAATIAAGTVTMLPAGSTPTVSNSGTPSEAVFDFGLPSSDGGVSSFNGRSGSVLPMAGDYSAEQVNYDSNQTVKQKIDALVTKEASDIAGQQSLLIDTVGWTGKNLIPLPYEFGNQQTQGGITAKTNADGSITFNGTVTASISFRLKGRSIHDDNYFLVKPGKYIFSCGNIENNFYWGIATTKNNSYSAIADGLHTLTYELTITSDMSDEAVDGAIPLAIYANFRTLGDVYNNFTIYPMLRRADITDPTYEPYHESVEEVVEQIYADNGVLGAKNLLPYPYDNTSKTVNGITFTDNGDGTVTINCTNSTDAGEFFVKDYFPIATSEFFKVGNIVNGISGGSIDTYNLVLSYRNSSHTWIGDQTTFDGDMVINPPSGAYEVKIKIHVSSGVTLSNVKISPMIRLASDPDDTYVPYAMTNRELTEKKINIADLKTVVSASSDFADFKTRIASL